MARHSYEGVFIPEPIAVGDGPENFDIYLAQQFAWAYSMIQILFRYLPKYISGYKRRQVLQFLFTQTWYAFWSISMAVLFLLPCFAILLDKPIAQVAFGQFILRYLPVWVVAFISWFWTKKWFQPEGLTLSWRGVLLHVARWPVVLLALISVILGIKKPYMITAKGKNTGENRSLSLMSQMPYFALLTLSFLVIWVFFLKGGGSDSQGYLLFVLEGILFFVLVYGVVLVTDLEGLVSEGVSFMKAIKFRLGNIVILIALVVNFLVLSVNAEPLIVQAVTWAQLPEIPLPKNLRQEERAYISSTVSLTPTPQHQHPLAILEPRPTLVPSLIPVSPAETPQSFMVLPFNRNQNVSLGAYDPKRILDKVEVDIEHTFVVWFLTDNFSEAIKEARVNKRYPLISLEPWPLLTDGLSAETLLEDINEGRYDKYIRDLAKRAKFQKPQTILVRWGHEMELTGLYPWSQGDPEAYISAYRRVVDIFEELGADNVYWVWSPGGNNGAEKYYPGDNYVDYIGVTILADYQWEQQAGFSGLRSFETLLAEKYRLSEEFDKLLIAVEVGASMLEESEKKQWLLEAKESFSCFPKLVAFLYFNDVNAHEVNEYRPDWSITRETFEEVFLTKKTEY